LLATHPAEGGMIDVQRVRAYHRNLAELRRMAEAGFDRARHHDVQRSMLLARERQRHSLKRPLVALGTSRRIIEATSKATGVPLNEMFSVRQSRVIAQARAAAAWLVRKHTHHSYPEIGRRLGGRDHTTIMQACRKVQADLDTGGEVFGAIIEHVETELGLR
jgi:chromosomal replication initiation ATPase DnaA